MAKKRVRKQPQRTCIGCQRIMSKRELVRIVRMPDGKIAIDPTGKVAGRGAYLCPNRQCWLAALRKKHIGHTLRTSLAGEERAQIEEYASQLPDIDVEKS